MSDTITRAVQLILNDDTTRRLVTGSQISRMIFATRQWEIAALNLQGATNSETINNINEWLYDFRYKFGSYMSQIAKSSGYTGFAITRTIADETISKKIFEDLYTDTISRIQNKDLTQAAMLERSLASRWKTGYKDFYNQYDQFTKEGFANGLTMQEINNKFMRKDLAHEMISLKDKSGRLWKPENYVGMYSSTRSSEIENNLLLDDMKTLGMEIVTVSSHNTSTPICQQYEGKTFALDANDYGLPVLPIKTPFHPRCKHVLYPKVKFNDNMIKNNKTIDKQVSSIRADWSSDTKATVRKQENWNKANRK